MKLSYNVVAGQSVERLAALSDGLFGVAMTLLLLDLHVPGKETIHGEHDLVAALWNMRFDVLVYLMSFMTLGIFWVGQQTQLNHLSHSDRNLTWLNLGFLFAVTLVPFSTRFLIDFIGYRVALVTYWGNLVFLGAGVYACWGYANRAKLVKAEVTHEIRSAVCLRIVYAQILYGVGAALCVIDTRLSIGFIVMVQLNYALAPRHWFGRGKAG